MQRKEILDNAIKCVCGERDEQYGSPEKSFETIAEYWNVYKGANIFDAHDVAVMMALLKIARITTGQSKDDNYIDLAGYSACAAEVKNESNSH